MRKLNIYKGVVKEVVRCNPNYKIGSIMPDSELEILTVGTSYVTEVGFGYQDITTKELYSSEKECYTPGEKFITNLEPISYVKQKKRA